MSEITVEWLAEIVRDHLTDISATRSVRATLIEVKGPTFATRASFDLVVTEGGTTRRFAVSVAELADAQREGEG